MSWSVGVTPLVTTGWLTTVQVYPSVLSAM